MIVVIIAGGSGTRLWPLSTPDYPKHLLKINGDDLSLLQQTYQRAKRLTEHTYVISEQSHMEHVREQLGELPDEAFICEPARRGTANCIIAALAYIGNRHDANEPIVSLHADHYIRDTDGFSHTLKEAGSISETQKRIVLVGAEPDYPAVGFGYIEKGDVFRPPVVFDVRSFEEKPNYDTAKSYYRSGKYLWNCGFFVASLNTFTRTMRQCAPDLYASYQTLAKASAEAYEPIYKSFESVAIDYALIEKVPDLLVVQAAFDWMDLGSFSDLHSAMISDQQGNHAQGNVTLDEVSNSLIQNNETKPIAVIGLDNVVVVNTAHGIIVARKDVSQKIGDISKKL